MEGCPRMAAACLADGVELVRASELTTEHAGHELHMFGYFLDAQNKAHHGPRALSGSPAQPDFEMSGEAEPAQHSAQS